jgi:hypothetical protein
MKRPLEEAAELLRHLSERSGTRNEPELYRALGFLAEGLHRLDQRLDKLESEPPPRFAVNRPLRLASRRIITKSA